LNAYKTKDGRWFFFTGLETARHLPSVLRALERTDLHDDERFADASTIRRNRREVIAVLDEIVASRTFDEWTVRFDAEGVFWAAASGPADVVDDPQLGANDGFVEVGGGAMRSVNGPITFYDVDGRKEVDVPHLGEHTDEVLAELADGRRAPRS
jgi:crotonobetainyl-CoA:carnitine CoA-transferase CaiB-like acyl-CoA transferase